MADDFNIQLQIKINETQAVVDVNAILKRLEQNPNLEKLKIKLDFDDTKLRAITQQLQGSLQQMQNVGGQTSNVFKSMASNAGSGFSEAGSKVKAITEDIKKSVRQLQDSFGTLKTSTHFEYPDGNRTPMYRVRESGNSSLRTKTISEPNGNPLSEDITDTGGAVLLRRQIEDIKQAGKEQIAVAKEQAANEQKINNLLEQRHQIYKKINNISDSRKDIIGYQQRHDELATKQSGVEVRLTDAKQSGNVQEVIRLEKELNGILNEQAQIASKLSSITDRDYKQKIAALDKQSELQKKLGQTQAGKPTIEILDQRLADIQAQKDYLTNQGRSTPERETEKEQQMVKLLQEEVQITKQLVIEREKAARALQQGTDKIVSSQQKKELQDAQHTISESLRVNAFGDKIGNFSNFSDSAIENIRRIRQELLETFGPNAKISVQRVMQGGGMHGAGDKEVYNYTAQVEKAKGLVTEYRGAVDKATQSIYQNGEVTRNNLSRNLGLMDRLKVAMQNIPVWILGMTAFWGSIRAIQGGVKYIVDLDNAMVDLRKVTDETKRTYSEFAVESTKIAALLNTTSTEVIKATAEFSRLGYTMNEAKTLAKEALLYSSVGDVDAKTATSNMISIIKGYGLVIDAEGKNIRNVVDQLNEVGNNYSITVEGIGSSLRRSAASLHEAGNNLSESIALTVSANTVIQDPESVGTALKTISIKLHKCLIMQILVALCSNV